MVIGLIALKCVTSCVRARLPNVVSALQLYFQTSVMSKAAIKTTRWSFHHTLIYMHPTNGLLSEIEIPYDVGNQTNLIYICYIILYTWAI